MILASIILAVYLSIATVMWWKWMRRAHRAEALNRELLELTEEQRKVIEGARMVNRLLTKERECEEWPEILG